MSLDTLILEQVVQRASPGSRLVLAWELLGGASARMTAIEVESVDGERRRMVLRQPPAHYPNAARREYALTARLHALELPVPEPIFFDGSRELLPAPYFVQAYIDGQPEYMREPPSHWTRQAARTLAAVHAVPVDAHEWSLLPPMKIEPPFRPGDRLSEDDARLAGRLRAVLGAAAPFAFGGEVLLHGDYWPGNLLWREGVLVGVVDWEDAARGDPLYDLSIARLDLLTICGESAMQDFSAEYLAVRPRNIEALPLWDLHAALRLMRLSGGDWDAWAAFFHQRGRADLTGSGMRSALNSFIAAALHRLGLEI